MSDLEQRLNTVLEPVLELADPRQRISAYHDMPYALFRYDPEEEFELRKQVTMLETRLTQKGKRIKRISLAECLDEAMRSQRPLEEWFVAEREQGVDTIVETVHSVLSEYMPLVDLVAATRAHETAVAQVGELPLKGRDARIRRCAEARPFHGVHRDQVDFDRDAF